MLPAFEHCLEYETRFDFQFDNLCVLGHIFRKCDVTEKNGKHNSIKQAEII